MRLQQKTVHTTTQGTHVCNKLAFLSMAALPEFVSGQLIEGVKCHVFNSPLCRYDVILGQDFLQSIGMIIDYSTGTIKWLHNCINMKDIQYFDSISIDQVCNEGISKNNMFYQMHVDYQTNFLVDKEDDVICDDAWEDFAAEILKRKYKKVDVEYVAKQQHHLKLEQKLQLQRTLEKYIELLNGKLGRYNGKKFHIDLVEGTKLVYQYPYKVPYRHERVFKSELDAMVVEGTIEPCP